MANNEDRNMIKVGKRCCGCEACVQACPSGALLMRRNDEGFLYPFVDSGKCVHCGACENACPLKHPQSPIRHRLHLFAVRIRERTILAESSSGGAFTGLARDILAEGGVVFGAVWDARQQIVMHQRVEDERALERIRGSKYVQSKIGNAYLEARTALNAGRKVLFSGTPCQLAGLRAFLGKDYPNLISVDIVCHGVPSPSVLSAYLEEERAAPVEEIRFRDKSVGWKNFSLTTKTSSKTVNRGSLSKNPYLLGFLSNLFLRPSCYACPANKLVSDITLADYWNVGAVFEDWDDDLGVSAVIVSSERGLDLLQRAGKRLDIRETPLAPFFTANRNVLMSSPRHPLRRRFMRKFAAGGIPLTRLISENLKWPTWATLIWKIKRHFRKRRMKRIVAALSGESGK